MKEIRRTSLGEAWIAALREVHQTGQMIGDETQELLLLATTFEQCDLQTDVLLGRYGSSRKIQEMRKVFFTAEENIFGHSYRDRLQGPRGARDLSDVVELLAREPWSKRAVATLVGPGDGRVPCINAIHFLRRDDGLEVNYFARGQDMFNKFYADAVCIHEMAERVASALNICVCRITGVISSAHIYLLDLAEIRRILTEVECLPRPAVLVEDMA